MRLGTMLQAVAVWLLTVAVVLSVGLLLQRSMYADTVGRQYNATVGAVSTATNLDFGFPAWYVLVKNDGANEIYVNFIGALATTGSFEIKSGESVSIPPNPSQQDPGRMSLSIVCASSETATVRVLALGR